MTNTEKLIKEGTKALKLWNGIMIGSIITMAAGIGIMAYEYIKTKIEDSKSSITTLWEDLNKIVSKDTPESSEEEEES